ncbi:hypothetical protein V6U71_21005 [Sphingopyxis sp. J-6]|uniref:hypothetical protein n=1 Tax=Sphingopyxis sp. J-6 TaxID=3122054 RepID=UPI0039840316
MKYLVVGLAGLLAGCAGMAPLEFSSAEQYAGYPVFVGSEGGKCRYGVQDMISMDGNSLFNWMKGLPEKSRQIDLVLDSETEKCVGRARQLMIKAGFTDIHLRKFGDLTYTSGLPPG